MSSIEAGQGARAVRRAGNWQDAAPNGARRARGATGAPRSLWISVGAGARSPFSVFVDAIDEYVEGLDARQLATRRRCPAELAHVIRRWLRSEAHRGRLQQERYRTHRAVRALLEHLGRTRPLVLVLDDIHWADSGSVELLGALLRHPPAPPCSSHWRCGLARCRSASQLRSNGRIVQRR